MKVIYWTHKLETELNWTLSSCYSENAQPALFCSWAAHAVVHTDMNGYYAGDSGVAKFWPVNTLGLL